MTATDLAELAPVRREHVPFVLSSWRGSGLPRSVILAVLRRPDARAVVAHVTGSPDDLIGWAAAIDGSLVYAYTRFHLRKNGYGALMIGAIVPDEVPVRCAVWTDGAQRLADHGFPLVPDLRVRRQIERFA